MMMMMMMISLHMGKKRFESALPKKQQPYLRYLYMPRNKSSEPSHPSGTHPSIYIPLPHAPATNLTP